MEAVPLGEAGYREVKATAPKDEMVEPFRNGFVALWSRSRR
jgi:hypothetical protein